jgi:hypothetical protein
LNGNHTYIFVPLLSPDYGFEGFRDQACVERKVMKRAGGQVWVVPFSFDTRISQEIKRHSFD